ncbi:MAG: zinc ribbon domain-containing protein [Methanobacteriota archaeon]|nr:MAG: zinc ribbon domain-containing protein [Euryarchaeota archaeon]
MASEKKPCWNCGHSVGENDVVCENCGMGLLIEEETKEETTIDELDALLEDVDDISIGSFDEELDSILEETTEDFDIDVLLSDDSDTLEPETPPTTQHHEPQESQEFRVEDRNLPDMLENISKVKEESLEADEVFVAEPQTSTISVPEIPSFEDFQEKEEVVEVEQELVVPKKKSGRNLRILVSLFSQYVYWSFIFILLGVLSIDLNDPNVVIPDILPLYNLGFDVITLSPHLYFGVGVFFPMGWFFRYKLKQWNSSPSILKGLLFLIGQFVFHSIFIFALLLLNPGVVFSLYLLASWFSMLVSIFVGGLLTFFFGYRFFFEQIYEMTPASRLEELEAVS